MQLHVRVSHLYTSLNCWVIDGTIARNISICYMSSGILNISSSLIFFFRCRKQTKEFLSMISWDLDICVDEALNCDKKVDYFVIFMGLLQLSTQQWAKPHNWSIYVYTVRTVCLYYMVITVSLDDAKTTNEVGEKSSSTSLHPPWTWRREGVDGLMWDLMYISDLSLTWWHWLLKNHLFYS